MGNYIRINKTFCFPLSLLYYSAYFLYWGGSVGRAYTAALPGSSEVSQLVRDLCSHHTFFLVCLMVVPGSCCPHICYVADGRKWALFCWEHTSATLLITLMGASKSLSWCFGVLRTVTNIPPAFSYTPLTFISCFPNTILQNELSIWS